ncbi:MAG: HAD family hydrolase [Candidatus Limnocylindrales bacterium]|nr:HAD family hydrolase [Candidatus Limnocylindrales bacterium]
MTRSLHGIDLVIFDKDGTLIEFDAMWSGWAMDLAAALRDGTGVPIETSLFAMLGFDPATGRILPGGGLAATPMARLRERTYDLLIEEGSTATVADGVLADAWHAPDPVELARPIADLGALFGRLRTSGRRIAVATSDDRDPTERTLAALGVDGWVEATVCADDGVAVKPAPDMVLHLCATLGVAPARTAVVGDAPADLTMGRRAGAGLVIGVLSGVGDAEHLGPAADLVLRSVADLQTD